MGKREHLTAPGAQESLALLPPRCISRPRPVTAEPHHTRGRHTPAPLKEVIHHVRNKTDCGAVTRSTHLEAGLLSDWTGDLSASFSPPPKMKVQYTPSEVVSDCLMLKASVQDARLVPRQVDFISSTWQLVGREDPCPKANSLPTVSGDEHFWEFHGGIGRGRGYVQKQHSQPLQSSRNWSHRGLTGIILIVLSTGNLQFKGGCVFFPLRPVLGIVAAYIMAKSGHQVVNFFHVVGVLVFT